MACVHFFICSVLGRTGQHGGWGGLLDPRAANLPQSLGTTGETATEMRHPQLGPRILYGRDPHFFAASSCSLIFLFLKF
jgi:hypothetical protein